MVVGPSLLHSSPLMTAPRIEALPHGHNECSQIATTSVRFGTSAARIQRLARVDALRGGMLSHATRCGEPRCCATGDDRDGDAKDRAALTAWRLVRAIAPTILTGAGDTDGEEDAAAALFNTFLIRLPFLAGVVALAANLLLGGGFILFDEWVWPPSSLWRTLDTLTP
jgi:hypothetical protein